MRERRQVPSELHEFFRRSPLARGRHREHRLGAGVADRIGGLARSVRHVNGAGHRPDTGSGKDRVEEGRQVGELDRYRVSPTDAERDETPGQRVDPLGQRPIIDGFIGGQDRGTVAAVSDAAVEQGGQRVVGPEFGPGSNAGLRHVGQPGRSVATPTGVEPVSSA